MSLRPRLAMLTETTKVELGFSHGKSRSLDVEESKFCIDRTFLPAAASQMPSIFNSLRMERRVPSKRSDGERRAEDPFRGLRAGPVRLSPSPSAAYLAPHPNDRIKLRRKYA
jgi:hypothetical protein